MEIGGGGGCNAHRAEEAPEEGGASHHWEARRMPSNTRDIGVARGYPAVSGFFTPSHLQTNRQEVE